jgi:hypothetical protein
MLSTQLNIMAKVFAATKIVLSVRANTYFSQGVNLFRVREGMHLSHMGKQIRR